MGTRWASGRTLAQSEVGLEGFLRQRLIAQRGVCSETNDRNVQSAVLAAPRREVSGCEQPSFGSA